MSGWQLSAQKQPASAPSWIFGEDVFPGCTAPCAWAVHCFAARAGFRSSTWEDQVGSPQNCSPLPIYDASYLILINTLIFIRFLTSWSRRKRRRTRFVLELLLFHNDLATYCNSQYPNLRGWWPTGRFATELFAYILGRFADVSANSDRQCWRYDFGNWLIDVGQKASLAKIP